MYKVVTWQKAGDDQAKKNLDKIQAKKKPHVCGAFFLVRFYSWFVTLSQ